MVTFFFLLLLLLPSNIISTPPASVPSELYNDYTLNEKIPVSYWYLNNSYPPTKPRYWKKRAINKLVKKAKLKKAGYYRKTDDYLFDLITKYPSLIAGKQVAVLGSVTPWYESIVIAFGGYPTTIEYNKILTNDSRIKIYTVGEYEANPKKFDTIISISSIEHDGLGRYGDPINPYGDLDTMKKIKGMLKKSGKFLLAVPVGKDLLVWNAHRIYGPIRLPLLLKEWNLIDSSGFSEKDFSVSLEQYDPKTHHQPVFLLTP